MSKKIRILHLEDVATDAELIQDILKEESADFVFRTVDTKEDFRTELTKFNPSLILSDFSVPGINGKIAINLVKEHNPDIPVIIVTGTLDEETAVELMKAGAADYILKQNLNRLIPAVLNTLEKHKMMLKHQATLRSLAESEERFRTVFNNAAFGMAIVNLRGYPVTVNPAFVQLLGYTASELKSKKIRELTHPDDQEKDKILFDKLTSGEIDHYFIEKRYVKKNRDVLWVKLSVSLITDKDGLPLHSVGMIEDITDEIKAKSDLIKSEEKYRLLTDNTTDLIWKLDMNLIFTYVNPAVKQLTGFEPEEYIGKSLRQRMSAENYIKLSELIAQEIKKGTPSKNVIQETTVLHKDGTLIPIEFSAKLIYDQDNKPVAIQGTSRDIRERLALQEQLRISQKLEGIGQLAGGIAHDFNNLLTIINGYSELVLNELKEEDWFKKELNEILDAGKRAQALTTQILAFSRHTFIQPQIINPVKSITNINKILMRLIGENIQILARLSDDTANIKIDPGQFDQVLLNLVVNARDAILEKGEIIIETRNVILDQSYSDKHISVIPGEYMQLSVSDNGKGMDEQTQAHIFEPFFTTKGPGKGTGMGLSTVYGIVKQNNGNIWVYSEIGQGTTFKIYFPVIQEGVSKARKSEIKLETYRGDETILIVEDDPAVMELTNSIVEYYGYHVIASTDAEQALEKVKNYLEPIHLLITDVIMPKMNGRQLANQIEKIIPSIKVLFVSGYTDDSIVQFGFLDADVNLLTKPYSPIELAKKIKEILSQ